MSRKVMDLLLQLDESKLVKPSKQVEVKRLSAIMGEPVIFTVESISASKFSDIQSSAITTDKKGIDIDMSEIQKMTVLEGVKDPSFKSKELKEKYGVPTPVELINKLLLPGEITSLYNVISDLSGFGDNVIEEIKN